MGRASAHVWLRVRKYNLHHDDKKSVLRLLWNVATTQTEQSKLSKVDEQHGSFGVSSSRLQITSYQVGVSYNNTSPNTCVLLVLIVWFLLDAAPLMATCLVAMP